MFFQSPLHKQIFSGFFHDGGGDSAQTHGTVPAVREQRSVTVVQQDPADFLRGRFAAFRADTANGEIGQSLIQMREPDPCPAGFQEKRPLEFWACLGFAGPKFRAGDTAANVIRIARVVALPMGN